MRDLLKVVLSLVLAMASGQALADLPIVLVDEARLPYDYSPSNYDISPSNYDNSISNYDNSRNGNRRLIYSANGSRTFAGYYVIANNGTTNFFSTSGKRMFYTPKGGRGVYGGKDGSFCGALVVINGQFSLALTDNGLKIMYLSN
ncbi:hypothetical protein A8J89_004604 [Shigella sonnei]|uniref:hypothetical protein n=1 Tax=Shigella sonnei TaxID=624 RepID=UPI000662F29B|nr:hypothetical protein [Shigella sonnei]EAA1459973.1 hypothetical protein [Shigella flexneri]EJG7105760.1 hypothetical protein [Escherichia coli]HCT4892723.1 hypothetical protein [Proteus mirabilis]EAA0882986.1 hypothetical protein [Shigella sonnei]EAA0883782.1 hypothetical protein [Shigella sonnei]